MKNISKLFSCILVLIFSIIFFSNGVYSAITTVTYVGTANDLGGGSFPWLNTDNVIGNTTTSSASSTITTRNAYTNYISLTNFDISSSGLPSNAIINGIQVNVERDTSNNRIQDTTVQLTKDGLTGIGNNNGNTANSPTAKTITTYGSTVDLWGTTWIPSELLSPNFGVLLQYRYARNGAASVNIYRANITIDYTIPVVVTGPGGASDGLQIWLKADVGTSTTIDGNTLTTWNDQSGNGFDAGGGVSPIYRNNQIDNLNFNPVIDFNGTSQYLENLGNGAYSDSYFMVIVPDNTIDGTLAGQVPFGFDCYSGNLNKGNCSLSFAGLTLGAFTAAINDEIITHAIGASPEFRTSQTGIFSYQSSKPMLIGVNENLSTDNVDIYEKSLKVDNFTTNPYKQLAAADYSIGRSTDPLYPFYYDGKIAEIINYNSRITDIDRQKIESYLSIKYGITLNNGIQDYIGSDGITNIWSTSTAGVYTNDIFGIGRDDLTELGQIKSKSINDDNIITLEAIGEGTNNSPSFTDIDELEFLSISNNGAGNTWTVIDAPLGYNILSRSWLAQETGELGTVNLDFDVGNVNFDIPALSLGTNYYYIYDINNNGILSDDTPQVMTNISGNIWQIAGINLDHGYKFSIATQASINNIPTDITLSNNLINENLPIGSIVGTLTTSDLDILDSHTYSFVSGAGDQDNSKFSIVGNTLYINVVADYETQQSYGIRLQTDDGNLGQFQKAFTININDIGEIFNTIIDFETPGKYVVTSGNWIRTTADSNEGLYSIESDNGGLHNTQSCFEVTNIFSSTGSINFDYKISSQINADYLRFYIDNVEISNWSGNLQWNTYSKNDISSGTHQYKWCYIKDNNVSSGVDKVFIDYITFTSNLIDTINPIISGTNYASGSLLPGGNHNLIINYSDPESGINVSTDIISLYKWNGSVWGADISPTGLNLGGKVITATSATYPTNNLDSGKYRLDFQISDNNTNQASFSTVFYIDKPELIISTGIFNVGNLVAGSTQFSTDEIIITIKTIGAGFQVQSSQDTSFSSSGGGIIVNWNGIEGVGYDFTPYSGTNKDINTNSIITTQVQNINTNGIQNTHLYNVKIGTLINTEQQAGDYEADLSFYLYLNY